MKFIVSSSLLYKEIQVLGGIINSSNTLPILDNFLFEINNNILVLSSSDLESTMTSQIEIESTSTDKIAISAKLLTDILKTFSEQPLTFIKTDNNTIEISASNGKYSLAYLNGDEFPKQVEILDAHETVINGSDLGNAINSTIFASGTDDLRPVMSGVFFQFNSESLKFVATDAHKLVKFETTEYTASEVSEFIMPKKPLQILKGILQTESSDLTIQHNDSNAKFIFDKSSITCRLIDGKFPNYEAVIPKDNPNVLTIDRQLFLNSARRVSIFSNKTTNQIRLKLAGSLLNISAEDFDFSNKADENLECQYSGDDIQIGFNSKFLIEMLNNLDSDMITLSMSHPNRAGIIRPLIESGESKESITMLVMPVMLNDND
ncbi:MAG: DNA polymerase III subunit beta [Candidatus Marisimplicoccus sp.]|jgi:DNA polymerase-3 subunit beta|nr:DNA polymerase III subunit beta [Flavobacteriaceae bacterium]RZP00209.1 MAG: DNA polymerase III subunit beta [Flavobacteriales bacterium]|tara:strand:+ start:908 stop:2035 length:1128 start_codon:yes stop_codon:yes gene_type:complete